MNINLAQAGDKQVNVLLPCNSRPPAKQIRERMNPILPICSANLLTRELRAAEANSQHFNQDALLSFAPN
jgi:hypothetical protein